MQSTSAVDVSIHATSPLFGVGAGAAAAAEAAAAGAASAGLAASAGAASFFCSAAGACASVTVGATALKANATTDAATTIHFFIAFPLLFGLERFFAGFAGPDAHDLLQVVNEYLP